MQITPQEDDFQLKLGRATTLVHALNHHARLRILELLDREGPKNVSQLSTVFAMDQPSVSTNLRLLLRAGLVLRTRRKGFNFYSVNIPRLKSVSSAIKGLSEVF